MAFSKTATVPEYIYSARTDDALVPFFERQYFKQVQRYDDSLAGDQKKKDYARRIGYIYMQSLKAEVEARKSSFSGEIQELGQEKFTWKFLSGCLNADSNVFCFGAGTNITFELALIETFGCTVRCFDPTPQAMEFCIPIARRTEGLEFYPYGVLARDTIVRFYKPTEPGLGSLSVSNLGYGDVSIDAPVYRLLSLMRSFKVPRLDLLKIDIEGAEYDVIDDLLFSEVEVDQLCVEFDQPMPPWRTQAAIHKLFLGGYHLLDVSALNCLFVHERVLQTTRRPRAGS